MRKLLFLLTVSVFFITLFLLSSVFAYNGGLCCCKDVCDCSGDTCNVGSPCDMYVMCPSNYVPCHSAFCMYCYKDSDCKAIDSDGGKDIFTKGICHMMYCVELEHRCEEGVSITDSGSSYYDYVDERFPSDDLGNENDCETERIYCPDGYEYSDRACVEIGAHEGEACDEQTPETTCVTGLQCCEQCSKCYETCPNDLCCDSDDDCPTEKPYCNLATNVCQETEAPCPRSEYDSCDKAAEGEISCGGTLNGCLYKTDDKYYKVEGTAGKEVNVTLTHSGVGCRKNDLYIYSSSCGSPIASSTGSNQVDRWIGEPETDIIVKIDGDYYQTNENCKWELKVKCKDVCPESNSKCTGPFDVIEAGVVDVLEGCLYAHDSKFYSVHETADRKVEVRVTHYGGSSCEINNDLIIYDTCSNVIARIENQKVESWIGKNPLNDIKIEIHSDSDNKNCLWKLEVSYVSEKCIDICTAGDGTDCSPFRCIGGVCSSVCDVICGAECDGTNPCDEGWFCNSNCQCVEGVGRVIELKGGWNMISQPFEEFSAATDCDIAKIYRYKGGPLPYERLPTLEETIGGYGYWVKVENDCEITFIGTQVVTHIDLEKGWSMIGTINNEDITVNEIIEDCVDLKKVYKYTGGLLPYERLSGDDKLYPGIGYWVHVESSCTII